MRASSRSEKRGGFRARGSSGGSRGARSSGKGAGDAREARRGASRRGRSRRPRRRVRGIIQNACGAVGGAVDFVVAPKRTDVDALEHAESNLGAHGAVALDRMHSIGPTPGDVEDGERRVPSGVLDPSRSDLRLLLFDDSCSRAARRNRETYSRAPVAFERTGKTRDRTNEVSSSVSARSEPTTAARRSDPPRPPAGSDAPREPASSRAPSFCSLTSRAI